MNEKKIKMLSKIVVMLTLVILVVCCMFACQKNVDHNNVLDEGPVDNNNDNIIAQDNEGNQYEEGDVVPMPTRLLFSGSSASGSSVVVRASVSPSSAVNQNLKWSLSWETLTGFAKDKEVYDYVALEVQDNDFGNHLCELTLLKPFGTPIILTCKSVSNPSLQSTCRLDFNSRVIPVIHGPYLDIDNSNNQKMLMPHYGQCPIGVGYYSSTEDFDSTEIVDNYTYILDSTPYTLDTPIRTYTYVAEVKCSDELASTLRSKGFSFDNSKYLEFGNWRHEGHIRGVTTISTFWHAFFGGSTESFFARTQGLVCMNPKVVTAIGETTGVHFYVKVSLTYNDAIKVEKVYPFTFDKNMQGLSVEQLNIDSVHHIF